MTASIAQDAIELLLDLAERGEIDPWDVEVIEVIDRHLSQLAPTPSAVGIAYEANLSQSGQAFLYASMLLLLKADTLVRASELADDDPPEENAELWLDGDDSQQLSLPIQLETQLRRRAVAPPPRKRPVSLQEMIHQLESIAEQLESDPYPERSRRRRKTSKTQAAREIGQLAHQESLTETAADIEQFLLNSWDAISQGQAWVSFDRLIECWTPNEDARGDIAHRQVAVFWALLLLSSQSKVELEQAEFYREIQIRLSANGEAESNTP